ncbi:MAG: lipopolysaccharide transport system ATP-binding protein [Halieaceae bacterium]
MRIDRLYFGLSAAAPEIAKGAATMKGSTKQSDPVLSMKGVRLYYPRSRQIFSKDRHYALDGINLDLYRGQTLGIVGRNGAGKSSLLKILAGVLSPDEGQVIKCSPDLRISLLTLQLGFQPHLSGRENAILACLLMGMSRHEADEILPEVIAFSGLKEVIDNRVLSYSAGMRARLGFSVAYFTQSDVMLIDEILGVGDHEFKIKSREAILSAIQSNRTVVLVSHDEQSLKDLCDSLIWIEHGRTVMQGSTHEVLETYHDYDHMVSEMSKDFNITREEFRRQPSHASPVRQLQQLRVDIIRQRKSETPNQYLVPDSAVRYHYPGRRESLSTIVLEDCGRTVWIENTREMLRGQDHEIRKLYQQYEDILANLARLAKIDLSAVRRTGIAQQLVDTMYQFGLAHHKQLDETHYFIPVPVARPNG